MTDLIGNLGARVRTRIGLLPIGLATLVGFGIGAVVMAPRSTDGSTAQACTRIVAALCSCCHWRDWACTRPLMLPKVGWFPPS